MLIVVMLSIVAPFIHLGRLRPCREPKLPELKLKTRPKTTLRFSPIRYLTLPIGLTNILGLLLRPLTLLANISIAITKIVQHICRKTTVLSCHRCLINTQVEKLKKWTILNYRLELWPLDVFKKEWMLVFKQLFTFLKCAVPLLRTNALAHLPGDGKILEIWHLA
jgi:hypothetical protein